MEKYIRPALMHKYEFHNYGHALEILHEAFPAEWADIQSALEHLRISISDIQEVGGNESAIPKKIDHLLSPLGWHEIRISGDLMVRLFPRKNNIRGRFAEEAMDQKLIAGYIDGHNIDFIKGKVAFDLEWNSKDQTFDRDLLAMRTYHECGLIEVGIILTRSKELNDIFKEVHNASGKLLMPKYGASTTWMGKLEYRLQSRRNGGCPILAIGIKKPCVEGYE